MNTEHSQYIPFTKEQLKQMADMYRAGKSSYQISRVYGIDHASVIRRLKMMGVTMRPQGRLNRTTKIMPAVKSMRDRGVPWRAIAEKFDISASHLQHNLKRYLDGKTA